jgi:hypothetical protein
MLSGVTGRNGVYVCQLVCTWTTTTIELKRSCEG